MSKVQKVNYNAHPSDDYNAQVNYNERSEEEMSEPKQQASKTPQMPTDRAHQSAQTNMSVNVYIQYKIELNSTHTCDDKLIMSLRNHGTQVRDNIVKMARNVIKVTNLKFERENLSLGTYKHRMIFVTTISKTADPREFFIYDFVMDNTP